MAKKAGLLNFKLKGIQKVRKSFKDKVKSVNKGLRQATRQAAIVIQAEAKSLAPVRTGALRKGILVRRPDTAKRGQVIYSVILSNKVWYGRLVEHGWKHRGGKSIPAHPFMRPAYDHRKEQAANVIVQFVSREIHKV